MAVQLYANLISQPSRAVAWLLKVQNADHELVRTDLGSPTLKSEEFLAMNPNGLVPVLKDGDFSLFEGNAILTYLADKYQWDELYPKDAQVRAKVNEYLHWHHLGARKFTTHVVRPYFYRALGVAKPADLELIKSSRETIKAQLAIIEKLLVKDYVARTDAPTVADYSMYCEFDQLESMGLLDLTEYPKTAAWIERMKKIPFHDEIREEMNGVFAATGLKDIGKTETTEVAP